MTLKEFSELKINSVLYNKNSNEIVIVTSERSIDAKPIEITDCFSTRHYGGEDREGLLASTHEEWEIVTNDAPDKVKLDICITRLTLLENFVFARIKT